MGRIKKKNTIMRIHSEVERNSNPPSILYLNSVESTLYLYLKSKLSEFLPFFHSLFLNQTIMSLYLTEKEPFLLVPPSDLV